jgi:hypothetical protein
MDMRTKTSIFPETQEFRSQVAGLQRGETQPLYLALLEDALDQPLKPAVMLIAPDSSASKDHLFITFSYPRFDLCDNIILGAALLPPSHPGHNAKRTGLAATLLNLYQCPSAKW